MASIVNIPFNGPQAYDEWCHVCSVVALDWVDLKNVTSGIFIRLVTGSILRRHAPLYVFSRSTNLIEFVVFVNC